MEALAPAASRAWGPVLRHGRTSHPHAGLASMVTRVLGPGSERPWCAELGSAVCRGLTSCPYEGNVAVTPGTQPPRAHLSDQRCRSYLWLQRLGVGNLALLQQPAESCRSQTFVQHLPCAWCPPPRPRPQSSCLAGKMDGRVFQEEGAALGLRDAEGAVEGPGRPGGT